MPDLSIVAIGLAIIPLARAGYAHRRSALIHPWAWALSAWVAWLAGAAGDSTALRFLALCLVACAGIAVLGARRPGVTAWHAVVGGLLGVLLLPWMQEYLTDVAIAGESVRVGFLGVILAVALLNYVPTRLGLGAIGLGIACGLELVAFRGGQPVQWPLGRATDLVAGASPWLAWLCVATRPKQANETEMLWWYLRDGWGFLWAHRIRDQFRSAAQHAGVNADMRWHGPRPSPDEARAAEILRALLTRFGPT
jgi:hypothetical protein